MPSKGDVEFGQLALREKLVTWEKLTEAIQYMEEIERDAKQTTLDRVMLQMGFLTEAQVSELNKKQGRRVVFCTRCCYKLNVAGLAVGQKVICPKCSASNVTPERIAFEIVERSRPVADVVDAGGAVRPAPQTVKVSLTGSQRLELEGMAPPVAPPPPPDAPPPPPPVAPPLPPEPPAPAAADEAVKQDPGSKSPATARIQLADKGRKYAGRKYGKR